MWPSRTTCTTARCSIRPPSSFPPPWRWRRRWAPAGQQLLTASVAGYEVGIRVGEFLGRSHYKVFHTTGTAGTLAAAAAVGNLLGLDAAQMRHAFGSAGTQSAGLWEFLRTAADSKQLHTAHAAAAGLMSAYLARDGFTGAADIFEGPQGMAAGMSSDANPARLTDGLGTRWATAETSFKYHASCRHTHPAADALLQVMQTHDLQHADLARGGHPCAPGRHRRAGPGGQAGHGAPEQVLHGHGAGAGGALRPRRPDRICPALRGRGRPAPCATAWR